MGCDCGSVGRGVASDCRTFTINCTEKMKIKEKEARNGPFKNNNLN